MYSANKKGNKLDIQETPTEYTQTTGVIENNNKTYQPQSNFMLKNKGLSIGEKFPDVIETDNSENVIILFLSSTCLTCMDLFPKLNELSRKNKNLFLYFKGEDKEIEEIVAQNKLKSPITHYDMKDKDKDKYKVSLFPYYYYLSKEGIILSANIINNLEELEKSIST